MRYENAKNILPIELLKEVQKYAEGKILYVPSGDEKKEWGEVTGYRMRLQKRNQMICNKYKNGITVTELSEEYYLSVDSIKKIIYSKKKGDDCEYAGTVASALAYDNAGMMEEWVHTFLQFSCGNCVVSEQLLREQGILNGLVKLPLRLIRVESSNYFLEEVKEGIKGVEKESEEIQKEVTQIEEIQIEEIQKEDTLTDGRQKKAEKIEKELQCTYDNTPPLLLLFEKGMFILLEKEDVFHNLKRFHTNAWPVYIWTKKGADYELFMKHYGTVLRSIQEGCNTKH